mmetsp:Transcript_35834/g.70497  ORF Transcript_35834/g.70497 Transcript_35834/m.70497 type:complete len:337 (-) Transcript_35834:112-1122(-)|eukprot:CAMPEP_0194335840 /NCGR_PEP_ID=MMETSP0171-20130528/70931_1 /TAXON_ID=218684 /ORGANISM="Corethron pennatum, Strain L29A3" /LENGTH=336 /DNA_ID=CAMNT_0039099075 /DNA_START=45 /DNA_END=1055 /DNA_ORIENTATION=+
MKRSSDSQSDSKSEAISQKEMKMSSPPAESKLEELLRNEMVDKSRRLAKNREHVRSCRARKKAMVQNLQDDISVLKSENQSIKIENDTLQNKIQTLETTILHHIRAVTPGNLQTNNALPSQLHNSEISPSLQNSSLSQLNLDSLASSNPALIEAYLKATNPTSETSLVQSNISLPLSQKLGTYESLFASNNQGPTRGQNISAINSPRCNVSSILSQNPESIEYLIASLNKEAPNNSFAQIKSLESIQAPILDQITSSTSRLESNISASISQNLGNYESLAELLSNSGVASNTYDKRTKPFREPNKSSQEAELQELQQLDHLTTNLIGQLMDSISKK